MITYVQWANFARVFNISYPDLYFYITVDSRVLRAMQLSMHMCQITHL